VNILTAKLRSAIRTVRVACRFLCCGLVLLSFSLATSKLPAQDFDPEAALNNVWEHVQDNFYDKNFNGVDWDAIRQEYLPQAKKCENNEQLSPVINLMLDQLETSHTHYYTKLDPAYYFLASLFKDVYDADLINQLFPDGKITYVGIGIFTEYLDGSCFVSAVLDGGPADLAHLRRGQRLVSADGKPFHPIRSFEGTLGKEVTLTVQNSPSADDIENVIVRPIEIDPQKLMMDALEASMKVFPVGEQKIAYAHLWSYAGERFHNRLKQELFDGTFKDAHALILDIRDGWGGANPEYLNLFNKNVPTMTSFDRNGEITTFETQWRKPVALLINGGTRSGKETIAYGFRKFKLGHVIGSRTAGAVTAGRFFLFKDGSGLYLAVRGVRIDDDVLEGKGVLPDVEVPWILPYAAPQDPQLRKALELISQQDR
jgi:carboxyl-terminal processing protease